MVSENDRIELVSTDDPYTNLEPGDRGTVTDVSRLPPGIGSTDEEKQISVEWDSGSSLKLIDGVDEYRILDD